MLKVLLLLLAALAVITGAASLANHGFIILFVLVLVFLLALQSAYISRHP